MTEGMHSQQEIEKAVGREFRRLMPPGGKCLPFYAHRQRLMDVVRRSSVTLVVGHAGSGKSTQMIQYAADAGLGGSLQIVCTQPRKLAAMNLAKRVAEEWDGVAGTLGQAVGFKASGFHKATPGVTRMKFVTNRVLLNEILADPLLTAYNVVIVDEAHERSIDMDILLGMLKTTLQHRGPNFRIIVTSATVDEQLMSSYFGGCPVVKIPGRTYPVDVIYGKQEEDYAEAA